MQAEVDAGRKAGIVVLVARHGKIAYERAFGHADLASGTPMRTDSHFRVYSMTKPVISVALLTLYEEGMFQLTDPLAKYIPAMKNVSVYAGPDENGGMVLESPKRPITIQDVFRHTAGFASANPEQDSSNPVERAYMDIGADIRSFASVRALAEEMLPRLPLLYHPGDRWEYSVAHDVQAYLIELFSGMPVDQFLRERIFEPLQMHDSFYGEPTDRGPRWTTVYGSDGDGGLEVLEAPLGIPYGRFAATPRGGAGLTMSPMDYARFSQMLLNDGELGGVRILGRKTVELMTTNHLDEGMVLRHRDAVIFPGFGYGLGVGVCVSPIDAGNLASVGQYGWGGAATTWVIIDPREDLVAILCCQFVPTDIELVNMFQTLVYQSIVDG
jgi:CubicO group peptidase (beta-lactamase class C family)